MRGPVEPPEDVVIVALDEGSYSLLGVPLNNVWPRRFHADLLTILKELGAKKVLFDVLFNSESNPEDDRRLADAIKELPVVLGVDSKETVEMGLVITQQVPLLPILKNNASGLGLVGFKEESGYVRSFYRHINSKTFEAIPTLGQAALDTFPHGLPGPRDLINFYGPEGTIPSIPVKDLLSFMPQNDTVETSPALQQRAREVMRKKIEGKVVYVGLKLFTELGVAQKDSYRSPFEQNGGTYGVEIHATVAANIARGDWIRRNSATTDGLIIGVFTFILSTLIFRLRPDSAGIVAITFIIVWGAVSYFAFRSHLLLPGVTLCLAVVPASYLVSTLYYYFTTRRSQQQTKRAFEFYLSPEMAEEVAKNPASLALGGKGEYATAMFTDIAGFTSITEKMSPEQVSEMLNAYFSEVMEAIFPLKGTLIKFIGDAVFALWGAPLKVPDHALKACQAALAIQEEVSKFNESKRFPPLKTRIGIHTGSMVVGNLGSHRRFDFTAIGDSVNLASRVEGVNKYFGTSILVTDSVTRELKGQLPTLLLGTISVAGKNESIGLHLLRKTPLPQSVVTSWEKALRDFQFRRWEQAKDAFNAAAAAEPELTTAKELYLEEIASYEQTPPPEEWMGTISFSKK